MGKLKHAPPSGLTSSVVGHALACPPMVRAEIGAKSFSSGGPKTRGDFRSSETRTFHGIRNSDLLSCLIPGRAAPTLRGIFLIFGRQFRLPCVLEGLRQFRRRLA